MEVVDRWKMRLRLLGRGLALRLGRDWTPARLALDTLHAWDGSPLPRPPPAEWWEELLLEAVSWLGPLPVGFLLRGGAPGPELPRLVRFARRLQCPVALWGQAEGIDEALALELVDAGLDRAQFVLAGVDSGTHQEVVGGELSGAARAVLALLAARDRRGARTRVWVEFPLLPVSARELQGVLGWARQVGADAFAVTPPLQAPPAPAELPPELAGELRRIERGRDPFLKLRRGLARDVAAVWRAGDGGPGARGGGPGSRRGGPCGGAGLRLELRADGSFGACPFLPPAGRWEPGRALARAWESAREHRRAIESCARSCRHPELTAPPIPLPLQGLA